MEDARETILGSKRCQMTFTYRHDNRSFTGAIHCIGPAIQVVAFEGEFYASLAISWMQSGDSLGALFWTRVDVTETLAGAEG
jgi:hypothetical protein